MDKDRPTQAPAVEQPLPAASLPLKAVQEEPSQTQSQSTPGAQGAIDSNRSEHFAANGEPTSAEASAAATLGMLTSVATSQQQQQQAAAAAANTPQPSSPAVNQGTPQGASSPQLQPYPSTPNPLPPGYNKDQPICANCSTQTTPLWRRSHDSTHILCNACALFFKMKGRPRPISLKTDVIKSRNRSKGKSTSKDRNGPSKSTPIRTGHERGESTSRSRESDVVGRKSAPGPDDEDAEMDGRSHSFGDASLDGEGGRKARKTTGSPYGMMPMAYAGGVPGPYGYPYPGYPHPHGHAPYPPAAARARSRSSDASRRATSLDSRGRVDGTSTPPGAATGSPAGYAYPPPPGYVHPEGAPPPGAYGYPPYYGYAPPGQAGYYAGHGYPPGAHAHGNLAHLQAPSIVHAQSDSRSRSPVPQASTGESTPRSGRSSASASPPHPSTHPSAAAGQGQHWPHPNPNYHLHQPHTHSPLGGARPTAPIPPSAIRGSSAAPALSSERGGSGGVTLAPIAAPGDASAANGAGATGAARPHLPSIGSVGGGAARSDSPSGSHVPRHTALFESRFPPAEGTPTSAAGTPAGSAEASAHPSATNSRERGHSVSSNNSASVSGSSEGVRSPEVSHRHALPQTWGKTPSNWTAEDERRGRPEKRFDDLQKGKTREIDEIDELDELDDEQMHAANGLSRAPSHAGTASRASSLARAQGLGGEEQRRMVGVETGLNELRMGDHHHYSPSQPLPRERGRSRGQQMSAHRSQSTSRARGISTGRGSGGGSVPRSSSSGRKTLQELEAENARLRAKNNELAFINGLMQSRLGQLEGPGRVPTMPMSGLAGVEEAYLETSASPSAEDDVTMDAPEEEDNKSFANAAGAQEDELAQMVREDPAIRAKLLDLLRAQQAQ